MKKRGFALLLTAAMLLALAGCGSSKYATAASTDAAASENSYAYDDAGVDTIGEADWGEVIAAENAGIEMACLGHYETEIGGVRAVAAAMRKALNVRTLDLTEALRPSAPTASLRAV